MILEHFNYSRFKTDFYARFKDPALFEAGDTNFMKLVMECLVVRYAAKWKIRPYVFQPAPGLQVAAKRLLYRLRYKQAVAAFRNFQARPQKKVDMLLVDNGRTLIDRDGKRISFYFHYLKEFLGRQGISFLHYFESYQEQVYENDFHDQAFRAVIKVRPLTADDKQLIRHLRELLKKLEASALLTAEEMKHIRSGLTVFFESVRLWDYYLQQFQPSKAIILGHYHREGLLYACRKRKVRVIELQHGLIAKEDIFYVLPAVYKPIRNRALFADRIYTYGGYWTDILKQGSEYSAEQIDELGYYLYEDSKGTSAEESALSSFTAGKKVILVTTQPALHADFTAYLHKWLAAVHDDKLVFIVKLHPADKDAWYDSLRSESRVLVSRTRLEVLFRYATIHLSSYSTTLYDALRYNVRNYAINFPASADYVSTIVREGYASMLKEDQVPDLDKIGQTGHFDVSRYFAKPNFEKLIHS